MPTLTILAGPNGSGKTKFTEKFKALSVLPETVINLDNIPESVYEGITFDIYRAERDLLRNKHQFFVNQCKLAIQKNIDFAFECNLRKEQVAEVWRFDEAGYKINLVYLILKDIEISVQRVKMRVEEKGHFVSKSDIELNFREGLRNLNLSFADFDAVYLIDNSIDISDRNHNPVVELVMQKGKVVEKQIKSQEFYKSYLPEIAKLVL